MIKVKKRMREIFQNLLLISREGKDIALNFQECKYLALQKDLVMDCTIQEIIFLKLRESNKEVKKNLIKNLDRKRVPKKNMWFKVKL